MSIITDEVLAAMASARIKARKEYAIELATCSVESIQKVASYAGIDYQAYEGDLLALIEVLVEYKYPQLVSEPASRHTYEGADVTVGVNDEVSNWFASGEAAAQTSAYLTPDVIKLDAQAMTPEYADMGAVPDTITVSRQSWEELSRSEASKYAIEKINARMAEIHRLLNRGDTLGAIQVIWKFAERNGFNLTDITTCDFPVDSPAVALPTWVLDDRLSRAMEGILDYPSLDTLKTYLLRPYTFEEGSHQNSLGITEVRSGLCNVLNAIQVAERIRQFMTGHWSTGSVDAVVQAALANNAERPMPEPISSWPQAGPGEEATQITPIIERNEVDPGAQSPSYYGPMD